MEIKTTCPMGSKCEEIKDGYIERCAWYTEVEGVSSNTGDKIKESRCAMTWLPLLQIENTAQSIGINDAVCSLRNETIKRQDIAIAIQMNKENNKNLLESE